MSRYRFFHQNEIICSLAPNGQRKVEVSFDNFKGLCHVNGRVAPIKTPLVLICLTCALSTLLV